MFSSALSIVCHCNNCVVYSIYCCWHL